MTNNTDSALYATSPDAMAAQEMGLPTRPKRPDWDIAVSSCDWCDNYVPSREELGETTFQRIRLLMEDGHSQTLTREHAAAIAKYAIKLLS